MKIVIQNPIPAGVYDPSDFFANTTNGELIVTLPVLPVASFNCNTNYLNVAFTDTSTDADSQIVTWNWSFGDGNTSSIQNPTYSYANSGSYDVSLTVVDGYGLTSNSKQTISVAAAVTPTAAFTVSANGLTISIVDDSTANTGVDANNKIVSETWNFGDGSNASITVGNQSYTYANSGTYPISLVVTDATGSVASFSSSISVTASAPAQPTLVGLTLTASKTTLAVGEQITLTPVWSYSDGSTKPTTTGLQFYGFSKSVVVQNPPQQWITNFVGVANGVTKVSCTTSGSTANITLTVGSGSTPVSPPPPPPPPPPPANTAGPIAGLEISLAADGVSASITDTSQQGQNLKPAPLTFSTVDFGDGEAPLFFRAGKTIQHVYAKPGVYSVSLTVSDANLLTNTTTTEVTITAELPAFTLPTVSDSDVSVYGMYAAASTFSAAIPVGQRVAMPFGSMMHYSDGSVCVENCYTDVTNDLFGYFVITVGGNEIYRGNLAVWAAARTRPFRYIAPQVKPDADLSMFMALGPGGESASLYNSYMASDNGPSGRGCTIPGIGSGGERAQLGDPDAWDAYYLKNPSAQNAVVVLGMSSAAAPWGFHAIDRKTNKMLSVVDYPKATMLSTFRGESWNLFPKMSTASALNLNQAWTHATTYCALACALFDRNEYDREELSMWANYVGSLWQNPTYRLPAGCIGTGGAARGKARTLIVLMYASLLSDNPDYFNVWVDALADAFNATFPVQTGVQIDQRAAASEGYSGGAAFAPWQQTMDVRSIGHCISAGYTKFQQTFDYFATFLLDAMEIGPHELLTVYNLNWKDETGNIATDWSQLLQFTAAANPKVAAALAAGENTAALQTALGYSDHQPGDFAAGDPTSDSNYIAQAQGAYAMMAMHATDQTRAQAAWTKFQKYNRVDYSKNPKYNNVPGTS